MPSNALSVPMTDPTGSGSSANVSSSSLTSGMTAPSNLVVETGDIADTIEHHPRQFAGYPATLDVPILRPPPPELRYMRAQHLSQSQFELQAQPAIALDTPSRQLMSGLSAACGSNMAEPYNTQHLDRQRAVSMQPLGQDAMRVMPQSAPLPGLNLLMDRMADNQNNRSAGLSQSSYVQSQRALSQQPTTQSFSFMSANDPAHNFTLVYDQSGQLLSMRPRAASQHLLADDSVGGDVPSTGIKISFSPLQQAVSSAIAHGSPLVHARDQMYLDPRAMDQQVAQSACGHLVSVDSQDNQLSPSQFQYAGVPSAPFSSPGHHAYRQSTPRGPPPGLPATGGFIWPDSQCEYAEQFMSVQDVLRNTVTTGAQQPVVEQTVPDPTVTCHPLSNSLSSPVSDPFSSGSQRPQFVAQESVLGSATTTTYRPQKPVFGFATTSEAENFQPSPRKPAYDMQATHGLPSVEQIQMPGQESAQPTRKKIIFGFTHTAPSGQVKPEQLSPAPFGDGQVDDGIPEPTNLSAQVWNNFAPYSASFSDVREQANFGSSKGSNDGGFAQVSLGNPSSRLEPGEAVDPNRYSNLDGSLGGSLSPGSSAEHLKIERLAVNLLSNHQVLFIFQVLAIMAHLRPEFVYRHGGEKGTKIGAKLTLWGHTVVIDPSTNSVAEAKVAACRRALELIQESNPEWLVPPQPIDGPTTPDWNWIWMLVDYCEERGWPQPLYRPSSNGNLWHCDISVKDKLFRTVRECGGLGEAQNTAAHTAIYQLMVIESDDGISDPFPTLPSSVTATATATATGSASVSAPVSTPIQKQCAQILRSGKLRPKRAARPAQYAGVIKAVPPSMMSKRARKKFNRQMELENQQSLNRLPPSPPPVVARASNMIPLMNSRLAPMGGTSKQMEEDPLAKLKSIEKELKLLSARASFRRVMEKICDVIGSNYPTIIRQKKPGNYPHVYEMLAKFDSSHPYLSRASPIKLADVENPDPEIAEEIAVKHVILHMLRMAKEDANISEKRYKNELGALRDIEGETKTCLDRQSRPSGILSY